MTDLQVRYQALQETRRANQAQEALKAIDVESNRALREATTAKTYQELDKVLAEIENLNARTDLTKTEKQNEIAKTVGSWISAIKSGLSFITDPLGAKDKIWNLFASAAGSSKTTNAASLFGF